LSLDGKPRLPKWKEERRGEERRGEERSGATLGEAGECFAVNKDAALAVD
jgi:hypothetical protein